MALDPGLTTLALISGMAAVFSPCGIAMLPAYIAMYFDKKESSKANNLKKGILFGLTVTLSFIVVFILIGLALSIFGRGLVVYTPWIALFLGFLLVILGALMIAGKNISIFSKNLNKFSDKLKMNNSSNQYKVFFLFGIGYAIAALSCTFPLFLTIFSIALTSGGTLGSLYAFLLYASGMGIMMIGISIGAATSKEFVSDKLKKVMPHVHKISGFIILLAGLYIIYYELTIGIGLI